MRSLSLALAAWLGSAVAVEVNPIRKVVTLMQEMQKEIEAEGETEKELFEKFMCYCKGNNESLAKQGEDAAAEGADLRAKVEAETSEKKQVDQDLAQAKIDRADAKQDLDKATKLREKEYKAFVAENADAVANLEATGNAITALDKGMGASLMQTKTGARLADVVSMFADKLEVDEKEVMVSFLSQGKDYAAQSGQIVGILKNMKDEMEKSIGEALDAEKAAATAFAELKAAKEKEIAATTAAIESLTQRSGGLAVSIVQNKNSAEDAEEEGADALKFLANLKKNCANKEAEYAIRVKTRNEEITAIGAAIGILNDDDALDLFKKTLKSPEPAPAAQAFLQMRHTKTNVLAKARALITSAGKSGNVAVSLLSSSLLSQLKSQQNSGKTDFSKVLKMIDEMVALLKKEQKDDEKHRDWCNSEFDKSEDSEKELTNKLASLASSIAELKDSIAGLAEDIANAETKIKELDISVAEATEQRKKEHAEFTQTVEANSMAVQLIGKAKNKLQKFYNPALAKEEEPEVPVEGEGAVAFVQIKMHQPEAPETFEGSYQAKGQKSGGIMALMDNLTKELETDISESEHDEKTSQKDYEELLVDAQSSRKEEASAITTKNKSKADQTGTLEEANRGHALKATALEELKTYVADLHQSCDFILKNFEARREARTQESEGLSRAKSVLSGADYS